MKSYLFTCIAVVSIFFVNGVAAANQTPLATQKQTEKWLVDHIEAWDDKSLPIVSVANCVIKKTTESKSELLNVKGVLLPIEVIRVDNQRHATLRVRVKEIRSAKYALSRECTNQNKWCKSSKGKFKWEPYIDFTVIYTEPYRQTSNSLTGDKADRLASAINHYARLCGVNYKKDEENIRF